MCETGVKKHGHKWVYKCDKRRRRMAGDATVASSVYRWIKLVWQLHVKRSRWLSTAMRTNYSWSSLPHTFSTYIIRRQITTKYCRRFCATSCNNFCIRLLHHTHIAYFSHVTHTIRPTSHFDRGFSTTTQLWLSTTVLGLKFSMSCFGWKVIDVSSLK